MSFGFAFGMGGVGAAVLGHLADVTSLAFVYRLCSFLPVIGLFAVFLPHLETESRLRRRPVSVSGNRTLTGGDKE
jgi:FSR family fosmidomycin resistance protein-like MFS transporter